MWPQSLQPGSASNSSRGNLGDPHALRPLNPSINSSRGNQPFGLGDTIGSYRSLGQYYFVGEDDRGDIARSLFYSETRYTGLTLVNGAPSSNQMGDLSSLLEWQDVYKRQALLREWLETRGYGVAHTGLTRSRLVSEGLRSAKEGHTLLRTTMDLFYATDFADRLENQIVPALRAGFVVLTDRYVYSLMARSIVRGGSLDWIEDVYRFAPEPHAVLYLKLGVDDLPARVLTKGGFDYWESGLDFQEETDVYASFVRYQTRCV